MAVAVHTILRLLALVAAGAAAGPIQEEELDCVLQPDSCTPSNAQLLQSKAKKTRLDGAKGTASASSSAPNPNDWYVLGISGYTVNKRMDSYAWVTVHPGGLEYKSLITHSSKTGNADLHIYVPTSAQFVNIDVYQKRWHWDKLLGTVKKTLTARPSWCDLTKAAAVGQTCAFAEDFHAWKWSWWRKVQYKVGSVTGYLVTGANVVKTAEKLHMRGRGVKYLDHSGTKTGFEEQRIDAAAIATELAYAKTGSVFPTSMHGIFWLDQRGVSGFPQACRVAEDELVMSFGMAEWDAATRCATGVTLKTSSPLKGQWSFTDTTGSGSDAHVFFSGISGTLDFCFEQGSDTSVDIYLWASLNSIINTAIGISPFTWMAWVTAPRQLVSYRMVKTSYGWDRRSRTAGHAINDFVLQAFGGIMGNAGFIDSFKQTCQYPVLQVVDGDGNPTEHFDKYLAFARKFDSCTSTRGAIGGQFDCARNLGNGTIMVPRMVA